MEEKRYMLKYRIPEGYEVEVIGFRSRETALKEKAKLERNYGEVRLEEYSARDEEDIFKNNDS